MSQHDMNIDNGPGLGVRTDFNAALQALASTSLGPTEPTVTYAGQLWLDTAGGGSGQLRQRDLANAAWVTPNLGGSTGTRTISVKTSSGSYAKPAGLKYLRVIVIGAGGGSADSAAAAAGNSAASGGGSGGGCSIKLYAASALAASTAYVVGLNGGKLAGNPSTFLGQTGGGGPAGGPIAAGTTVAFSSGIAASTATGGDINIPGGAGSQGIRAAHGNPAIAISGAGGGSWLAQPIPGYQSSTVSGIAGNFPGGGAGGCATGAGGAAQAGAAGGNGCIILEEFF